MGSSPALRIYCQWSLPGELLLPLQLLPVSFCCASKSPLLVEVQLQTSQHLSCLQGKEAATGGGSHPSGSAEPPTQALTTILPHVPTLAPLKQFLAVHVPELKHCHSCLSASGRQKSLHTLSMQYQLGHCSHFTCWQRIHILSPSPPHLLSPGLGWRMWNTHTCPGKLLPKRRK